jgi:hypothetical protein
VSLPRQSVDGWAILKGCHNRASQGATLCNANVVLGVVLWGIGREALQGVLAYGLLLAVGGAALWLVHRLAEENEGLRRTCISADSVTCCANASASRRKPCS